MQGQATPAVIGLNPLQSPPSLWLHNARLQPQGTGKPPKPLPQDSLALPAEVSSGRQRVFEDLELQGLHAPSLRNQRVWLQDRRFGFGVEGGFNLWVCNSGLEGLEFRERSVPSSWIGSVPPSRHFCVCVCVWGGDEAVEDCLGLGFSRPGRQEHPGTPTMTQWATHEKALELL